MPRIRFEKVGNAVWISHLDLMRVFQRAFRRGGILIRHSQGFTPRAHVSIALPLPVGTESVCELLDFDLAEGVSVPLCEIPDRLNATLPEGLRVLDIWEPEKKLRELTFLDAAITLEYDRGVPGGTETALLHFFQQTAPLPVPKRTKNGVTELDIRPLLQSVSCRRAGDQECVLECRVCAQNPALNPTLLVDAIRLHCAAFAPSFARVRRLEVLDPIGVPFR